MKRYEIYTDTFEFRFGRYKDSIPSMMVGEVWQEYVCQQNDPALVKSFENLDEALAFFRENYADYGRTWAEKGHVFWFLRGQLAWLDENEYTEDGEFDQGGTLWESSVQRYRKEND